ncbi:MAG TPA: Hpt domain-containing protein [Gammaproteobacteria bacterium]|nr:Hpt domain-containing protein [Gammaproteobacteria bacterium]
MQHADIHLDPDAIAALRALQMPGRPSIVLRVFDVFETSAAGLLADLGRGLASGDLALVTRAAHTLKSSSANIGATALAARAKALEHSGRDGDLEGCRAAGTGLQGLLDATLAAVAALRREEAA